MNKVNSDAPADVVTHYPEVIENLIKKGKVLTGTGVVIARAGIGVAVRAGAPKPDISSPDAFKAGVPLGAPSEHHRARTNDAMHPQPPQVGRSIPGSPPRRSRQDDDGTYRTEAHGEGI